MINIMRIKKLIRNQIEKFGYQIVKPNLRQDYLLRRMKLINNYKVDVLLDVGANTGQYGNMMRNAGFQGKIISFEPLSEAFRSLVKKAASVNNWEVFNYGLGNLDDELDINIAANSESSSFLSMLPAHTKHRPKSKYIGTEKVKIKKIDSVFDSICHSGDIVFLKIDAQGYEYNILEGAKESLSNITGLQIEMSLEPLYHDEKLMCDMIAYLATKGFKLMSIEPGSVDYTTGQMFQVDGIFFIE